jgi:acylglycerol lipase
MQRRMLLTAALAAPLVACAERLQPMGAPQQAPRLTPDAIITADGYRLPLRRRLPEDGVPTRAVIVGLHGFNDYSGAFEGAGRYFAGRGVALYAYDQRGFGGTRDPGVWAGEETLVADAKAAVRLVAETHPGKPVFLLGTSMGGAVVVRALTPGPSLTPDPPPPVAGAILVAPAVWGFETMGFFTRTALKLTYAAAPGWTMKPPPELNIRPTDNIDLLKAMGADPLVLKGARVDTLYGLTELMGAALDALPRLTVPTLAMYGAHEEVLAPAAVAAATERLSADPAVTLKHYPDGWHMLLRDLQGVRVLEDIAAWIDARLGS